MRPIPLETLRPRLSGFTLLEMILAIVIAGIVLGATLFFAYPIQQAGDVTTRAELTDMADNALQRIGRDVRLALPNSVRVKSSGNVYAVEFVPVRTGARYRAISSGATCGTGTDELTFNAGDDCFNAIGTIPDHTTVAAPGDFLALNNYGENFGGQNVYEAGATNLIPIATISQTTVTYASTTLAQASHASPGRRFFIVATPVSYVCDPNTGRLTRYSGYGFLAIQVTTFGVAVPSAGVATGVSDCKFIYAQDVAPKIGLLTLRLTLTKSVSTGTENVSLYHAIHVNNIP
jgi:MSHA biogenesis protein MshO